LRGEEKQLTKTLPFEGSTILECAPNWRLLANLRTSAPHGRCTKCADAVAEFCPACSKRMLVADAEQRASDARRHREEQEEAKRTAEWERDFTAMRQRRQKAT
jgi:hypothetical protein